MLREPALNALLELVGDAYGFEDLEAFRPGVLAALRRAVPSDWASYNEVGVTPDAIVAISEPDVPPAARERWNRLAHQHPVIDYVRRTRDGRPARISDHADARAFRALDLYREFYAPLGIESQVSFTLPSAPPLIIGIALSRGPEDFTDEECEILSRARPHLIQAYRVAQGAGLRDRVLSALERGLEGAGGMLVVADRTGSVQFAAPGTARIVARGRADRLDPRVREWIEHARAQPERRGDVLVLGDDGDAVVARLLAGRQAGDLDVLLLEPSRTQLTVEALGGLGLTQREAEALRWVALGRSAPEAARLMGVAPRTVAKHLQHVYAKLGVRSRSQAAATAWASVTAGENSGYAHSA